MKDLFNEKLRILVWHRFPELKLSLVLLSLSIWFFRLVNEGLSFSNNNIEKIWLFLIHPLILAAFGIAFASLYLKKYETSERRIFWKWSFRAAAIFCLPYVPDMFASFKKAGESQSVLLSAGFYVLGIVTYGLIRGGSCSLLHKLVLHKVNSPSIKALFLYLVLLINEFLFFHSWHPITYFPALPAPIPLARFESNSKKQRISSLLFETALNADERQRIATGGFVELSTLGSKLADEISRQVKRNTLDKIVNVVLPETLVSLQEIDDAHLLIEPVARLLLEEYQVERVVWIQGAFVRNNNVVLGSEYDREALDNRRIAMLSPPAYIVRRKREQMPMFEAPSKGVSYSKIQNDGELAEQLVSERHKELQKLVANYNIMICYESLFPSNWRSGLPSIILTNHHMFNEFHLMNWVYVGLLRQLSVIFQSPTQVVSNFNPSGILNPFFFDQENLDNRITSFTVVRIH